MPPPILCFESYSSTPSNTPMFPSQRHSSSDLSKHLLSEVPFPWRTHSSFSFWVFRPSVLFPSVPRICKLILFNYTLMECPGLPSAPSITGTFLSLTMSFLLNTLPPLPACYTRTVLPWKALQLACRNMNWRFYNSRLMS